jgi:hypothetical protein
MPELQFSQLPDSELCKSTIEYTRHVSEPFLFHHVMRSAIFADLIGRQRKLKFDPEILCVATVLHDLGLTKLASVQARFELEGADAAKEFLAKRGMHESSIETVWEAIALHTTPEIPLRRSPEVALCHLGIGADLAFIPLGVISDDELDEVLEAYPWLGMNDALPLALVSLYQKNPQAVTSHPVAEACMLHVPNYKRSNFLAEHLAGKNGPKQSAARRQT